MHIKLLLRNEENKMIILKYCKKIPKRQKKIIR